MLGLTPYLFFGGNCREAVEAYARIFGGEIAFMQEFGDIASQMGLDDSFRSLIMHATIVIGDIKLMASDAPGHHDTPQGMAVSLAYADLDKAKTVFEALAEGGEVTMPFESTFWAKGFGTVTDRFGTPWMVNVE